MGDPAGKWEPLLDEVREALASMSPEQVDRLRQQTGLTPSEYAEQRIIQPLRDIIARSQEHDVEQQVGRFFATRLEQDLDRGQEGDESASGGAPGRPT
jgi:hypothetical protein